jgi:3'-5' exoribonuclease
MFREALMLHYLDDLDSKMAAVHAALASDKGEGNWTAFSGALERRFLRVDLFRRAEESVVKDAPSQPPPLKSLGAKD